MNTKELTRNTRHAIEDMLSSQGITTTGIIDHRLEEILCDHNTAHRDTIIGAIESVAIEVLHTNNIYWTDATVTSLLRGIINKVHSL